MIGLVSLCVVMSVVTAIAMFSEDSSNLNVVCIMLMALGWWGLTLVCLGIVTLSYYS